MQSNGELTRDELARDSGLSREEVDIEIAEMKSLGVIQGRQWIMDEQKAGVKKVSAFIEVKITPERDGGFDRIARRIAKFDQVAACSLFSGGHDLVVEVRGEDLMQVASFVSEKLATIEGVLSTQSHFQLKTYKKDGILFGDEEGGERLPVAP